MKLEQMKKKELSEPIATTGSFPVDMTLVFSLTLTIAGILGALAFGWAMSL